VEVTLFHTDTVERTDLMRLITAVRGCFYKVFNSDDDDNDDNNNNDNNNNNNKL
jgi:hypothetical protein